MHAATFSTPRLHPTTAVGLARGGDGQRHHPLGQALLGTLTSSGQETLSCSACVPPMHHTRNSPRCPDNKTSSKDWCLRPRRTKEKPRAFVVLTATDSGVAGQRGAASFCVCLPTDTSDSELNSIRPARPLQARGLDGYSLFATFPPETHPRKKNHRGSMHIAWARRVSGWTHSLGRLRDGHRNVGGPVPSFSPDGSEKAGECCVRTEQALVASSARRRAQDITVPVRVPREVHNIGKKQAACHERVRTWSRRSPSMLKLLSINLRHAREVYPEDSIPPSWQNPLKQMSAPKSCASNAGGIKFNALCLAAVTLPRT